MSETGRVGRIIDREAPAPLLSNPHDATGRNEPNLNMQSQLLDLIASNIGYTPSSFNNLAYAIMLDSNWVSGLIDLGVPSDSSLINLFPLRPPYSLKGTGLPPQAALWGWWLHLISRLIGCYPFHGNRVSSPVSRTLVARRHRHHEPIPSTGIAFLDLVSNNTPV